MVASAGGAAAAGGDAAPRRGCGGAFGGRGWRGGMRWPGRSLAALLLLVLCAASGCAAFKFVYIPCEHGQPMEEWCLAPKDQEDEIGCLTNHLQLWFGKRGLTEEQKREFKEHVRHHLKKRNPDDPYTEILDNPTGDEQYAHLSDQVLTAETVEIVTVLPPQSQFGYVSVSLYIDDKGVARGLPVNQRATSLLETVSTRSGPILGDAFVARTYDNEGDNGGFRRLDLSVADISSAAGWIKVCQQQKLLSIKNHDKVREQMADIKNHRDMQLSASDNTRHALQQDERADEDASFRDEETPLLRDGHAVFPAAHSEGLSARQCLAIADELREMGNTFYKVCCFGVCMYTGGCVCAGACTHASADTHACTNTPLFLSIFFVRFFFGCFQNKEWAVALRKYAKAPRYPSFVT